MRERRIRSFKLNSAKERPSFARSLVGLAWPLPASADTKTQPYEQTPRAQTTVPEEEALG
jgi:hypothetical protein